MYGISEVKKGRTTFAIKVLWLYGMSTGNIAAAFGRTPGSVRGIVNRGMERARDEMTIEERREALAIMKLQNADLLPERFFEPIPLADGQKAAPSRRTPPKIAESPAPREPVKKTATPEPDLRTRAGRKEAQRLKREEARQRRLDEEARQKRELGGATRGVFSSALESLHALNVLADPEERAVDAYRSKELSSKERRKEAGLILRNYIDGSRVGGISTIDIDRVGTGSSSRLSIPEYRLRCMSSLGAIREMLGQEDYGLIFGIVDRDEMPWAVAGEQAKSKLYEDVRRCLDTVAVHERLMERDAFRDRWARDLPFLHGMTREQARAVSDQADELLKGAA